MPIDFLLDPQRIRRIQDLEFKPSQLPHEFSSECDLCSGKVFRTIAHQDRYGFSGIYQLCENCGLVFQNPHPTGKAYEEFYAKWYRPLLTAYLGRAENSNTIQVEQYEYARKVVQFLKNSRCVEKLSVSVDIGGSTGIVARAIEETFGGECLVVDPSPDELDVARKNGRTIELGLAETWDSKGRQFDFVLICRSIDHLLSIDKVFKKVASMLRPGGLFFVDFVDFETAARSIGDYRNKLKVDHVYYLSDTTMRQYFQKHGYEIVATDFANYQPGYLVRHTGRTEFSQDSSRPYAREFGRVLRDRLVSNPPSYPPDFLTKLYRRLRGRK